MRVWGRTWAGPDPDSGPFPVKCYLRLTTTVRMETRLVIATVVVLALIAVVGANADRLAPEQSTRVDTPTERLGADAELGATGRFRGVAGHTVRGDVELLRDADGFVLRFVDYEQTQGPDVFVYLTPGPDPTTRSAVEAGIKVYVDGGAGDGESTKEGTFVQRLPSDVDATGFRGVAIWCEDFGVPFGTATLEPVVG